jgi:AcrR family transcriptional regulator
VLKKSERTREAILAAARQLFAERGFDATTVREVATVAGIDPALVIRYFGGKDELFVRAAAFELSLPPLDQVPRDRLGEALLRRFVDVWEGPQASMGMAILLRSATSNEQSAAQVRALFAREVLPAVARVGSKKTAGRRAALVGAQLLGIALCRYLLKLPHLADMPAEELVRHVAPVIQGYLAGEAKR